MINGHAAPHKSKHLFIFFVLLQVLNSAMLQVTVKNLCLSSIGFLTSLGNWAHALCAFSWGNFNVFTSPFSGANHIKEIKKCIKKLVLNFLLTMSIKGNLPHPIFNYHLIEHPYWLTLLRLKLDDLLKDLRLWVFNKQQCQSSHDWLQSPFQLMSKLQSTSVYKANGWFGPLV